MKAKPVCLVIAAGVIAVWAFLSVPSFADNKQTKKEPSVDKLININLDENAAVAIAEVVLVKVYGEKVLKEKPWKVSQDEETVTIEGTLMPGSLGGVASIQIRKRNAEVIAIIHGK